MAFKVTVAGLGMVNAVGIGAPAVAAAVRAGINQYRDASLLSASGEPYKMALVPEPCLPPLASDQPKAKPRAQQTALYRRLLQLAKLALAEACSTAKIKQPIPLLLAVPEQRYGRPFPALEPILKDLFSEVDVNLDLLSSRVFPLGRAGGFRALQEAFSLLQNTSLESVIVGGVDSFLEVMLLTALDAEQRLLGSLSMEGFVPGEGAAFVVLTKTGPNNAGLDNTVQLNMPGTADEPGHLFSTEICLGDGLSQAIAAAVTELETPLKTVLCSLNGESVQGKEWGAALIRNGAAFNDDIDLQHPADCYGELGAATVPTLLGLATLELIKGNYQGPALVWAASDGALRGALVLSAIEPETTHG